MRRHQSFTNIQDIGEVDEKEEEDNVQEESTHQKSQAMQLGKFKNSFNYFGHGSKRNTAFDEQFFHCFEQYLNEAIKKLKEQG